MANQSRHRTAGEATPGDRTRLGEASLLTDDPVLLTSAQEQLHGRIADAHTAGVERASRPPAT